MKKLIIYIILSFLLISCKTQNLLVKQESKQSVDSVDVTFQYEPNYQYSIRKDDKVSISVWGQDELSVGSVYGIYNSNEVYGKWLLVDANGNIELPKIGTVYVLDKTIPQLKEMLKIGFQKWIINPISA
jgi:polysaccharide biosynthesis/export protein